MYQNNIIIKKTLAVAAILLLCCGMESCTKSYLDITPKGKLIAQNVSDYDLLFDNQSLISSGSNSQVAMSDDVLQLDPYYSGAVLKTQRLFQWAAVIYDPGQDATEMTTVMTQLYVYNKIINEVMDAANGTMQQKQALYAEALANRAWCYFTLINYYGKPYDSTTAKTDLCYPIITTADVANSSFQRATVQQCYDLIINDLTTAIPSLLVNAAVRARMTRSAAEALLGKVYVYMGRYTAALTELNAAVADLPTTFSVALYDLNVTMATGGTWGYNPVTNPTSYQSLYPTAWTNTENIFCKQVTANNWNSTSSDLLLTPQAASLFTSTDQRRKFFTSQPYGGGTYIVPGALRRNSGTTLQEGIRLADLYLLKAECEARTGDLTDGTNDLVTLRNKRMSAMEAAVTITDKDSLTRMIINEREREFALQGERWFDMRRLYSDPLYTGLTYTHNYYKSDGTVVTYTLTPERLVMQFPQKVIDQNPGMSNNP